RDGGGGQVVGRELVADLSLARPKPDGRRARSDRITVGRLGLTGEGDVERAPARRRRQQGPRAAAAGGGDDVRGMGEVCAQLLRRDAELDVRLRLRGGAVADRSAGVRARARGAEHYPGERQKGQRDAELLHVPSSSDLWPRLRTTTS